jgi:hypothetical protein
MIIMGVNPVGPNVLLLIWTIGMLTSGIISMIVVVKFSYRYKFLKVHMFIRYFYYGGLTFFCSLILMMMVLVDTPSNPIYQDETKKYYLSAEFYTWNILGLIIGSFNILIARLFHKCVNMIKTFCFSDQIIFTDIFNNQRINQSRHEQMGDLESQGSGGDFPLRALANAKGSQTVHIRASVPEDPPLANKTSDHMMKRVGESNDQFEAESDAFYNPVSGEFRSEKNLADSDVPLGGSTFTTGQPNTGNRLIQGHEL